jgi:hypothetical protein
MNKLPQGSGLIIGILLFALVYGFIYFSLFQKLEAIAPGAGIMGIVFALFCGIIGGGIEYHYRNGKK